MSNSPIRILLADSHQLFRHGLRALLAKEPDIDVIGEVGDCQELPGCVSELQPDLVCMEVNMVRRNAIELMREMQSMMPRVKLMGLSDSIDWHTVRGFLKAGARGFVSKWASPDELPKAIRFIVRQDQIYLCPQVTGVVMDAVFGDAVEVAAATPLTIRERQVLECIAHGMTSPDIARRLDIKLTTVRGYRANIMRNLDLHNGSDLTRYALRNGIVDGSDVAHPR